MIYATLKYAQIYAFFSTLLPFELFFSEKKGRTGEER